MATVKLLLDKRTLGADGYPIIFKIEHQNRRRRLPVGYRVPEKLWNGQRVNAKHPKAALINSVIASKEAEINRYLADCAVHNKPIHLELIGTGRASFSFTDYLRHRADQYQAAGKIVMGAKVRRFVIELIDCAGREVYFDDINLDFLRRLEQTMINYGNVENTRHKKYRFLNEFYSHAVKEGKAPTPNPFQTYKIATRPVKKDKLSEAEIKSIEDLQLSDGPINDTRNLFLFAFYCKGQRFETSVTLRRDQVRDGRIYFITNKGKDPISVKIHSRLQKILDQYPGDPFVFPFISELPTGRKEYLGLIASRNTIANRHLKVIAAFAKIKIKLTFHISRHSFANQLKSVTENIHVIKEALGHSDYRTTEVYLKALKDDALDPEMEKLYGV